MEIYGFGFQFEWLFLELPLMELEGAWSELPWLFELSQEEGEEIVILFV